MFNVALQESGRIFGVPSDQVAVGGAGGAFLRYEILIKCLAEGRAATVTLGDLSCITADVGHLDKDLTQFLNLATSQEVMFDKLVTFSIFWGLCETKKLTIF